MTPKTSYSWFGRHPDTFKNPRNKPNHFSTIIVREIWESQNLTISKIGVPRFWNCNPAILKLWKFKTLNLGKFVWIIIICNYGNLHDPSTYRLPPWHQPPLLGDTRELAIRWMNYKQCSFRSLWQTKQKRIIGAHLWSLNQWIID